jgi:hypothetical protein
VDPQVLVVDAVVQRRGSDWSVHVPQVDRAAELYSALQASTCAADLVRSATGRSDDVRVHLLLAPPGELLLPIEPRSVEVLHRDGRWYPGAQRAWVHSASDRWLALVGYAVGETSWERTVRATADVLRPLPVGAPPG